MHFHADNCTGQNKNNASRHYLLWRTMTGKHRTAELSFMLVATQFAPDQKAIQEVINRLDGTSC